MLPETRILWITILASAVVLDFFVEYPNKFHPVVFTGKLISFFDNHRFSNNKVWEFVNGMLSVLAVTAIWIVIMYPIGFLPFYFKAIIYIYILKSTFSIGGLARAIKKCISEDDDVLRKNVSLIVSRNVSDLDRDHLLSAAFESGSENVVDSVISPLFYFMLFGILGALVYRIINTADSMIGYRISRYEYFGKFAARADDVLNFIPARFFAFIVFLFSPERVLRNLKKYRKLKINGMYSMASMAGLFNVSIEKIGYYTVKGERFPITEDLRKLVFYIYSISYLMVFLVMIEVIAVGPWWG
ncbi:MAG: adenosylcobinamide-phosphate synthase CbiB [Thermoplasmatales archaeon]